MTKMVMTTLHRKPNNSKPESGHKTHLYLLHQVIVDRLKHAWAMDISYIPMAKGVVYLDASRGMAAIRDMQKLLLMVMLGFYDAGSQEYGQNKVEELNFGEARQNALARARPSHSRTSIGLAYRLLGGVPSPIP